MTKGKSDCGYFKRAYPIPGTALYLRNHPAWIVVDGIPRRGIVQLSNGTESYVVLDFRVVTPQEQFATKKAAEKAAKVLQKRVK